ncbi:MAG: hypothetical protein AAGF22_00345 [Pseudomonadota bacterium]
MVSQNYRTQARVVRAAAQEKLRTLRAERLAKLRPVPGGAQPLNQPSELETSMLTASAAEAPAQHDEEMTVSSAAKAVAEDHADQLNSIMTEAEPDVMMAEDDAVTETASEPSFEEVETFEPEVVAEEEVPVEEGMSPEVDDVDADEISAVADDLAEDPEPAVETPEPQIPESTDLDQLPGAGPGLIWMLQQQGIHSMSDLAVADPDELVGKLDLVGQLLNIPGWISYAQDAPAN